MHGTLNGELVVDLWGGFSDPAKTKLWEKDTIVNVFSTTKVIAALCIHILVDRGLIDVEAPVYEYWPEFAQANKENVLVKHLLSHSAGLPGFDHEIPVEALYDWDRIIKLLEKQKSWWKPGSKIGYHMTTFGYLVGELVRRITGKSLGEVFHDEISVPLKIDFHIHTYKLTSILYPILRNKCSRCLDFYNFMWVTIDTTKNRGFFMWSHINIVHATISFTYTVTMNTIFICI